MKNRTVGWVIGIVAVIVIVVLIVMGQQGKLGNTKNYQAVFLSNGQVYFGKVSGETSDPVTVKDVFYLRVQRQVQPATEEGDQQAQPQVQLIKLGNELHGPQDEMRINRDHILFIEDLKDDGRVAKAIKDFKDRGNQTPSPSPTESK